jgi:hypothetical protein
MLEPFGPMIFSEMLSVESDCTSTPSMAIKESPTASGQNGGDTFLKEAAGRSRPILIQTFDVKATVFPDLKHHANASQNESTRWSETCLLHASKKCFLKFNGHGLRSRACSVCSLCVRLALPCRQLDADVGCVHTHVAALHHRAIVASTLHRFG